MQKEKKDSRNMLQNLFIASIPDQILKEAKQKKVSISKYAIKKGVRYHLNQNFQFKKKKNKREAANFLIQAIRYWDERNIDFFCGNYTSDWIDDPKRKGKRKLIAIKEEQWTFSYKTPSTCGSCERAQKVLDMIFGNRSVFNNLPFVKFHGDRQYSFSFKYLKCYAEKGEQAVLALIESDKIKAAKVELEKKQERERVYEELQLSKLEKRFKSFKLLNKQLLKQILEFAENSSLQIVNNDLALVITARSSYGNSGCIAYYDQIQIFFQGQRNLQEKQTRDNAGNWTNHNIFDRIDDVRVVNEDNLVKVFVKVSNQGKNSKMFETEFELLSSVEAKELPLDVQENFFKLANEEMEKKMSEFEKLWEFKPQYFSNSLGQYANYKRPAFKYKEILVKHGVAVFIIEEQIDGNAGRGAQIRVSLYKYINGMKEAKVIDEDHAYESHRPAILSVISFDSTKVVYTITDKSERKTHIF